MEEGGDNWEIEVPEKIELVKPEFRQVDRGIFIQSFLFIHSFNFLFFSEPLPPSTGYCVVQSHYALLHWIILLFVLELIHSLLYSTTHLVLPSSLLISLPPSLPSFQYILRTCSEPNTMLHAGDTMVNKTLRICFHWAGRIIGRQTLITWKILI